MIVPLATGAQFAFWMLAPIMVLGALGTVLAKRPVHSALSLAAVMISLAIQYAALQAPFLFAAQIIVYTGAILMLFLFVMMIVGVDTSETLMETIKGQRLLALLATLGLLVLLISVIGSAIVGDPAGMTEANAARGGNVPGLAELIFGRYVVAFEATSALLITATLAGMVLSHREKVRKEQTQAELAKARFARFGKTGDHPGALPAPGVYARHNGVDNPALLASGEVAQTSMFDSLTERGVIQNPGDLVEPTRATVRAIAPDRADHPATAVANFVDTSAGGSRREDGAGVESVEGAPDEERGALRQAQGTDSEVQGTDSEVQGTDSEDQGGEQ